MVIEAGICLKREKEEDKISALPDDLLIHILSQVLTKDAVATMILSKRWSSVWRKLPKLDYIETYNSVKSVWDFLDKSMQLHTAPSLEILRIQLSNRCPADADVGKYISVAVERYVRELNLHLAIPLPLSRPKNLPECIYTCKTLVKLALSCKILVDVPSTVCLPSLESLELISVVYKDEDSHVRLLSGCPLLKYLFVYRKDQDDNVTRFSVKVPSLNRLIYMNWYGSGSKSLVIDSPRLNNVHINHPLEEYCSIQNMPRLDVAIVKVGLSRPKEENLKSFSSVMFLELDLTVLACCSAINFSRLIELKLCPSNSKSYWLEPLMLLLHNSPKLKVLMFNNVNVSDDLSLSWNQPSYVVPGCLSSHLEIFEWNAYKGEREDKKLLAYILANSKCLKTVGISPRNSYNYREDENMRKELRSMYRVSASSQLLFSTKLKWRYTE